MTCATRGPKRPLHFLHIGKTGGAAIKHALSEHRDTGSYTISLHKHHVSLRDIPVGEAVFFCLRDPVTRFVSGFYSRQRQGRPLLNSVWNADEKIAFGYFQTANQLASALSSLDDTERNFAEHAMSSIRHVGNRYAQWLIDESYLSERKEDIVFIGFQETLNTDFARLCRLVGLAASVTLPLDDVVAHRSPSSCDFRLGDKARANLLQWYEEDYVLMNYCRQLANTLKQGH